MDVASADNRLFFHPDREFHKAIYKIANMPHLLNTAISLVDHVEIFLNSRYYGVQDQQILTEQHKEIFQAFCNKDASLLCESLKKEYSDRSEPDTAGNGADVQSLLDTFVQL